MAPREGLPADVVSSVVRSPDRWRQLPQPEPRFSGFLEGDALFRDEVRFGLAGGGFPEIRSN
jgi:hypothetical protein